VNYLSVCSGIEAATVAWHPLGWRAVGYSEIEPFPSAVLAHHYPDVPNHGDFTTLLRNPPSGVDVLVGGTPCQAFSVAGLRGGLSDPRGNLALAFVALVGVLRPRWVVWENVPGVLSSGGGRDFGSFLGGLGELGYGWAYRVLDAQYFGLAQRRQRVFVVASPGDWRRAVAVLFEPEGVRRDSPPRRRSGAGVAGGTGSGAPGGGVAHTLKAKSNSDHRADSETYVPCGPGDVDCPEVSPAIKARDYKGPSSDGDGDGAPLIAHTLRAEGHDASEDGTGRGVPLVECWRQTCDCGHAFAGPLTMPCPACGVIRSGYTHGDPLPFDTTQITSKLNRSQPRAGDPCHPLAAGAHVPAIAFSVQEDGQNGVTMRDTAGTVRADAPGSQIGGSLAFVEPQAFWSTDSGRDGFNPPGIAPPLKVGSASGGQAPAVAENSSIRSGVRRLMPHELERLQGFPDGYTAIPWRGKPASECPDGPRAKALGNSMAVPVMRWIGERIALVETTSPPTSP